MPEQTKNPRFYIKVIQVILAIISTGLIADYAILSSTLMKYQVITGAVIGYLIASIIVVATYLTEGRMNKNVELMITISGAILEITASALIFELIDTISGIPLAIVPDQTYAAAVFPLAQAVVYIVDTIIIFLNKAS